jgi:hypothetical protein
MYNDRHMGSEVSYIMLYNLSYQPICLSLYIVSFPLKNKLYNVVQFVKIVHHYITYLRRKDTMYNDRHMGWYDKLYNIIYLIFKRKRYNVQW